jgi:fimbrial chaperone protein
MLRSILPLRKPLFVSATALSMLSQAAWADLMLFPTRVVFEKDQRAAQVELINQGKLPETYRISLVNRRMSETGEFIAIQAPGPGEQFADALLRYSPRQVTIPPGGSQTVRIMLRKHAELATGEYRSHLQFDRVADASTNSLESTGKTDGQQMGVMLSPLVGASIPVIVRHGDTQARINLTDIALAPANSGSPPTVTFTIQREGGRSVYGDLVTTFTPRGKEPIDVAKAGGVAVYVPNPLRKARMPLDLPEGVSLSGGILQVRFKERAELGGKTLSEASLTLP